MNILKWFRQPTRPFHEQAPTKSQCAKHRWRVYGSTRIGAVTCEHCGRETGMHVILDELLDKHQAK